MEERAEDGPATRWNRGERMSESLNLGALRSQCESFLMNTSTDVNSLSWSVAELNGYINEAVFYSQQLTGWFQEFDNLVCTASVSTYTAPANVYQFQRMTWDGVFLPQANEYELDRDDPSWRAAPANNPFRFYFPQMQQQYQIAPYPTPSQNGFQYTASQETGVVAKFTTADGVTADTGYTFSQETGIVIGVQDTNRAIIMFRPDRIANPFTTVSAELGEMAVYNTDELNIGMAFIRIPDTLVLDTDTPQLPVHCHFVLVFYTLMKCFMREGEFQDMQLAGAWFQAYADWMESVLENKARWWPTRVRTMEPFHARFEAGPALRNQKIR